MDYNRQYNHSDTFYWVVFMNIVNTPVSEFDPYELTIKYTLETGFNFISKRDMKYLFRDTTKMLKYIRMSDTTHNDWFKFILDKAIRQVLNTKRFILESPLLDKYITRYNIHNKNDCMNFIDLCLRHSGSRYEYNSYSYEHMCEFENESHKHRISEYDNIIFDAILKKTVDL